MQAILVYQLAVMKSLLKPFTGEHIADRSLKGPDFATYSRSLSLETQAWFRKLTRMPQQRQVSLGIKWPLSSPPLPIVLRRNFGYCNRQCS